MSDDLEAAEVRIETILPLLEDLVCADAGSRAIAAGAIGDFIDEEICRKILIEENLIQLLLHQTIKDSESAVVTAAWAVLCRLANFEDSRYHLVSHKQDIFKAIDSTLTHVRSLDSLPVTPWALTESLLGLLTSLSGAISPGTPDAVPDLISVPDFHLIVLKNPKTPLDVKDAVSINLFALTIRNESLAKRLKSSLPWQAYLHATKGKKDCVGITALGILYNIRCISVQEILLKLTDTLAWIFECHIDDEEDYYGTNGDISSTRWRGATQICLELVGTLAISSANVPETDSLTFKDPVSNGPQATEDRDSDAVGSTTQHDVPTVKDEEKPAGKKGAVPDSNDLSIPRILTERTALLIIPFAEALTCPTGTLSSLYVGAILALKNIARCVSATLVSEEPSFHDFLDAWTPSAQRIWSQLVHPILTSSSSNKLGDRQAQIITDLALAIAQSLPDRVELDLDSSDVEGLMMLYQRQISQIPITASLEHEVYAEGVQESHPSVVLALNCIAVLGSLAKRMESSKVNIGTTVSRFLVDEVLAGPLREIPIECRLEALDQLLVISADDNSALHDVLREKGILEVLEGIVPDRIRSAAGSVTDSALQARVIHCLSNLERLCGRFRQEVEGPDGK
ncbi:MAG: hypothetical protein M1825_001277 [Sarcosagium campestre]|nr:MAG: hypothetical protein M1825_001277 [Sarcosagium campestre]